MVPDEIRDLNKQYTITGENGEVTLIAVIVTFNDINEYVCMKHILHHTTDG